MGKRIGYRVTTKGGRFMGWAWDPDAGKYRTRTFDRAAEAKEWAQDQVARFRTKLDSAKASMTGNLVRAYLADLKRRGRVASHRADVEATLNSYVQAVPDLTDSRVVGSTLEWLGERSDVSPATRNKFLTYLKALCNFGIKTGAMLSNPLRAIDREKVPKSLKPQFTVPELRTLAAAIDDPFHIRFALMFYAGLRVQEAHNLTWERVDLESRVITVALGDYDLKGSKERQVPIQDELAGFLERLDRSRPLIPASLSRLYGSQHRRDLRAFCWRNHIEMGERSPHSLRHGYAGIMTATGVPSLLLACYMGHSSAQTTAGYAQLAAVYARQVAGWKRGEFDLLTGAASSWPKRPPRVKPKGGHHKTTLQSDSQ